MKKEETLNFLECACIFFSILFKYLLNIGIEKVILYGYLAILLVITCITLFHKKLKRNELLSCSILLVISALYVILYQDVNFLISFILGMLCIRKDEKSFIKSFFKSSLILYVGTIVLNILGIIPSHNMYRIDENGILKVRYSLGFTHPNEVFLYFIPIALASYCLYGKRKMYYLITFIIAYILYYLSDSRTGFLVILILIPVGLFSNIMKKIKFDKIVPYLFIIFTILSILIATVYGESNDNTVSKILSGRPYYWNYYIRNDKLFSILGNNEVKGIYLDNFYIYLLVQLGIISYIIYSYIYYRSLKKMQYNFDYMIVALIFLIYGISEASVIIGSIQFLFAIQIKNLIIAKSNENIERKEEIE